MPSLYIPGANAPKKKDPQAVTFDHLIELYGPLASFVRNLEARVAELESRAGIVPPVDEPVGTPVSGDFD